MTVYFSNKEAIDLNALSLMGVSVKTGDSPIGFFGTGLKFSIATLLRNGCTIVLYRNGERIEFTKKTTTIRGEEFDVVMMGDTQLGFTTQLGKSWEPWQAYRELYCNCLDEGGTIGTDNTIGKGHGHGTVFIVSGQAIDDAHEIRDQIFLSTQPIFDHEKLSIHPGDGGHEAYYRTVRALRVQNAFMFKYNVKGHLDLTEDRTIKHPWLLSIRLAEVIAKMEDEGLIEQFINAPKGTYESSLDYAYAVVPGEAFMNVCSRNRNNANSNQTAIKLWESHAKFGVVLREVNLSSHDERTLEKAFDLLRVIGCNITRDDFTVADGMGKSVYGMLRNGKILIAHRAFDQGHRFLASTIYEEHLHRDEHMDDESRDMQNFLFEKLFSFVERVHEGEGLQSVHP